MPRSNWVAESDDQPACRYCGAGSNEMGHGVLSADELHDECRQAYQVSPWAEGPITAPKRVLEGLERVRAVATVNMLERDTVAAIASALGYTETEDWVAANPDAYIAGVIRGFESDLMTAKLSDHQDWNTEDRKKPDGR